MLTFGTVCTGIGGIDVGFERQGLDCRWQIEIDKACRRVLRKRFPGRKLYEDATQDNELEWVNILAGGTPCQGFSIAGLRGGMSDQRSNLCFRFCQLADALDPDVIVWENVPGVLSLEDNSFGCFLAGLVGEDSPIVHPDTGGFARWRTIVDEHGNPCPRWPDAGVVIGPRRTAAWRVLDSQFFRVAQRRERVFVVASPHQRTRFLGAKRVQVPGAFQAMAAKVLFESEMLRRHTRPSREKAEEVAGTLGASPKGSGWRNDTERMTFVPTVDPHPPLDTNVAQVARALDTGKGFTEGQGGNVVVDPRRYEVRRLTPVECERLQGFDDDFTRYGIEENGIEVEQKDSPRYRQLGNAWTTYVADWLAKRIKDHCYE